MINNVVLVGRLTKDCDLKYTSSGTAVGNFTLAVNRDFTNQNGDREADFINCVIWRKPAETFANYTRQGSLVGVTGRLQTRSYENQQGQKVFVTELVVETSQFLESRDQLQNREDKRKQETTGTSNRTQQSNTNQFHGQQPDPNMYQQQQEPPYAPNQQVVDTTNFGNNFNNQSRQNS